MKVKVLIGCLLVMLLTFSNVFAAQTRTLRKTPKHKIELFVTSWCPYCKKAKAYLDGRGIDYQLYDIEQDADAARRKSQLSPNSGVPLAIIDGKIVNGWSQSAYEAALE